MGIITTFDTAANIQTEVEDISNYTIGTGKTISSATFTRFLTKAEEQVTLEDPGFSLAQCTEATALYICHQIYRKTGKSGVTSEGIGSYSHSRKLTHGTPWLDDYYDLIERVRSPKVSLTTLDQNGITRDDVTMNRLRLDQANVVSGSDADQPDPPVLNLGDLQGYL